MNYEKLKADAEAIVGRPIEIQKTNDGKYIVLWMSFNSPPPPKGGTEEEALLNFMHFYQETQKYENRNGAEPGVGDVAPTLQETDSKNDG
jgi:hypothetical protein